MSWWPVVATGGHVNRGGMDIALSFVPQELIFDEISMGYCCGLVSWSG